MSILGSAQLPNDKTQFAKKNTGTRDCLYHKYNAILQVAKIALPLIQHLREVLPKMLSDRFWHIFNTGMISDYSGGVENFQS